MKINVTNINVLVLCKMLNQIMVRELQLHILQKFKSVVSDCNIYFFVEI